MEERGDAVVEELEMQARDMNISRDRSVSTRGGQGDAKAGEEGRGLGGKGEQTSSAASLNSETVSVTTIGAAKDEGVTKGGGDVEEEEEPEESDDRGTASAELEDSSELSASDEDSSWISWFVSLRGNEYFCEVEEDYINDDFNLTGLSTMVPFYDYALDMILDVEMPVEQSLSEEQQDVVESAAEMLYGLIHARYILTSRGMQGMHEKYRTGSFGRCPRVYCQGQCVLPVGLSDVPRNCTVAVYCPKCQDIYHPKSTRQANVDGAYFGTTFPHLFLLTHADIIPSRPSQSYIPRIYGFKVHFTSVYHRANRSADGESYSGGSGGGGNGVDGSAARAKRKGGRKSVDGAR